MFSDKNQYRVILDTLLVYIYIYLYIILHKFVLPCCNIDDWSICLPALNSAFTFSYALPKPTGVIFIFLFARNKSIVKTSRGQDQSWMSSLNYHIAQRIMWPGQNLAYALPTVQPRS